MTDLTLNGCRDITENLLKSSAEQEARKMSGPDFSDEEVFKVPAFPNPRVF